MRLSSTTQRKNKPPVSLTTLEETPQFIDNTPLNPTPLDPPKPLTATVYRRKCGTSPFDEHWLNMDCCGLVCAFLTYFLHLYGCHVVCNILIPSWFSYKDVDSTNKISLVGKLHMTAFVLITMLAVYSHFKAMTTNPGAVPPDAEPIPAPMADTSSCIHVTESETSPPSPANNIDPQRTASSTDKKNDDPESQLAMESESSLSTVATTAVASAVIGVGAVASAAMPVKPTNRMVGKRLCRRCNSFKPKRAHHCSICKRCIVKMDHHCPWVNNCVGIGNHKFFLLFIFYTCLSCFYSLTLMIWRFCECTMGNMTSRCLDDPSELLNYAALFAEALLFGMFTLCMMVDQWSVVTTNVTNIDRLKGEVHFIFDDLSTHVTKSAAINEVFGGKYSFHLSWLSPLANVTFPRSLRDEIMGFCQPNNLCGLGGANNRNGDGLEIPSNRGVVLRSVTEIV